MDAVGWAGQGWLVPGLGMFHGRAGDQHWHHHMAHQISIGLDAPVTVETGTVKTESVETDQAVMTATAVCIPAGVRHRLTASHVISIYLDVLSNEARALSLVPGGPIQTACVIDVPMLVDVLTAPRTSVTQARALIHHALQLGELPAPESRLALVIQAMQRGVTTREQLAKRIHLSPSRFSHWFVEQSGLPLRSYVKWLRLMQSLQIVRAGGSLTEAAHGAGFSDAAHFSRTFRTLFGIDPSSALAQVVFRSDA